ncbi:MAG TPA: hypothetical protein VFQ63_02480, partial [Patescibacteria group bacterium]|nr:hypothetical protein [Patescibacteria group bacterium]
GDKFPTSFTKQVVGEMAKRETTILTPAWLAQYGRNPFERQVPTRYGEMVTLPARSMEFFYTPTNEEATRINEVLSSDHPTIFIPTCVPDAFFHAGGASIEYATDKPLTGDIAWTAQNTLDGLRVLLPELAKRGITPNIVMGMGDYEYYMSATRGMSEEAYRAKVNQSADRIARELQTMIAQTYGEQPAVETHVNLKGGMNSVTVLGGPKLPSVRITGMMELAGGKEKWQALLPKTAQKVRAAIASPDFAKLTTKTREKRRAMTDFWLTLAGNMSPTEDDFLNKFVEDAASYVAFDEVARNLYGANTLVFSGDSRAMEAYAAKIADLPLLSVSGLYKGSEGTE